MRLLDEMDEYSVVCMRKINRDLSIDCRQNHEDEARILRNLSVFLSPNGLLVKRLYLSSQ